MRLSFTFIWHLFIALVLIGLFAPIAWAEEKEANPQELPEVVITATRENEDLAKLPYAVDVITADEINRRSLMSANDLMLAVPGFDVFRGGTLGTTTLSMMRGSIGGQVLFLIDGIPLSIPYFGQPDLDSLLLYNFSRVEILQSDQSLLYGSEAMAGVVNFITDPGKSPLHFAPMGRGGNLGLAQGGARLYAGDETKAFAVGVQETYEQGQRDNDRFQGLHLSAFGRLTTKNDMDVSITTRYLNSRKQLAQDLVLDETTGMLRMVRDKDREVFSKILLGGANIQHRPVPWWDYQLYANFFRYESAEHNDPDPDVSYMANEVDFEINSNRYMAGARTSFNIYDINKISVGFDYRNEESLPLLFANYVPPSEGPIVKQTRDNDAFYLFDLFDWQGWVQLAAGVRYTDNRDLGDITTKKANAATNIKPIGLRLFGGYGEGYRLPNFQETDLPLFGNKDLKPERSTSLEGGLEEKLLGKIMVRGVYYHTKFYDLIEQDATTGQFQNIAESLIQSVETKAIFGPFWGFSLNGGHLYMDAQNLEDDTTLPYRPRNTWQYSLDWLYDDRYFATLGGQTVGERKDPMPIIDEDGKLLEGPMKPYTVANLALSAEVVREWKIINALRLFGRIDNLFNAKYEEQRASPMPGLNFSAGAEVTF